MKRVEEAKPLMVRSRELGAVLCLGDEEHCPRMKKDIDRNFLLFLFLFGIISLCILWFILQRPFLGLR
jgi:hypothetical protein